MSQRVLRTCVAILLAGTVPVSAWAACASVVRTLSASACHMPTPDHCATKPRLGDTPACCLVTPSPAQAPSAVFSPVPPRLLVTPLASSLPAPGAMPELQRAIEASARAPLKLPHDPTYLRISVLLI